MELTGSSANLKSSRMYEDAALMPVTLLASIAISLERCAPCVQLCACTGKTCCNCQSATGSTSHNIREMAVLIITLVLLGCSFSTRSRTLLLHWLALQMPPQQQMDARLA